MTTAYLYFTFSALFNAVLSTILGLLIYFKDTRNPVNKTFALFCVGVAAWAYPYIFWPLSKTAEETLFWFQILHIGACYVSIFYLHFVVTWLGLYQSKKKILLVGYLTSTFFALNVFSPCFIKDMVPKFSMSFWAEPGILYHFYLINFFGLFIYSCYLLFTHLMQTSDAIRKNQIKLILVGIALSFLGGSTNYFLWYNINFPPYGNILASSYVILTAIAILKYRLFEIRVILTELLVGTMGIILLIFPFFLEKLTFKIIGWVIFIFFCFIGYLLIKYTHREARQKEILEEKVKERTKELETAKNIAEEKTKETERRKEELERVLKAVVGRELRMIELKKEIKELKEKLEKEKEKLL